MKNLIIIAAIILSLPLKSQTFDGVYIGGAVSACVSKFQSKGYKLVKYTETGVMMKGSLDGTPIELYLQKTPKSGVVWKAAIYFPERYSWSTIFSEYQKYFEVLRKKYGDTRDVFSSFESPYEDGDGYEMTALKNDKVRYLAFWEKVDVTIMIEISKFAQVAMHYENPKNTELKQKETDEINSTKF